MGYKLLYSPIQDFIYFHILIYKTRNIFTQLARGPILNTKEKKKYLYQEIYQTLKNDIESGKLNPGDKLDNENELKDRFNISRDTLRKALAKLEAEGYIKRKKSLGTIVQKKKHDYSLAHLESFTEQMKARGITPSSEMISCTMSEAIDSPYQKVLNLKDDEKIYRIERIRKGDGNPISLEISYIPYKICPEIYKYLDETSSLYQIYEGIYHLKIGVGRITLEAEKPGKIVQKALDISKSGTVLHMHCLAHLENGTPLYYVDGYYKGDSYYFSAFLTR